jgi:hypothetical protein
MPRPPLLPRWAFLLMCGMWGAAVAIGGGAIVLYLSLTEPGQRPEPDHAVRAAVYRSLP